MYCDFSYITNDTFLYANFKPNYIYSETEENGDKIGVINVCYLPFIVQKYIKLYYLSHLVLFVLNLPAFVFSVVVVQYDRRRACVV